MNVTVERVPPALTAGLASTTPVTALEEDVPTGRISV